MLYRFFLPFPQYYFQLIMKKFLLLAICLIFFESYSQISVGRRHIGKAVKFEKGTLEKFKKSETVFVLSSIFEPSQYDSILKDVWTVTPYKIVSAQEYNKDDYLDGSYSFVRLTGYKLLDETGWVKSVETFINVNYFDFETFKEELNKMSSNNRSKKKDKLISNNYRSIARIQFQQKDDFNLDQKLDPDTDEFTKSLLSEDILHFYDLGFLKNYFQKLNQLLIDEEIYWMYEDDYLQELKQLKNETLYIPNTTSIKFNSLEESAEDIKEDFERIFKNYEYDYEFVSPSEINSKILDGETIYYLRLTRLRYERFLHIVNSKTGEIVYRGYIGGSSSKFKTKHINQLSESIAKAVKK